MTGSSDQSALDDAWARFLEAARWEREASERRAETRFPHFSEGGAWRLLAVDERSGWRGDTYEHGNWTAGFWHGVMWLLAIGAKDGRAADAARDRLPALLPRAEDTTTHDLGFLFYPSFALGCETGLAGGTESTVVHTAARTLAARFNTAGHFIQAFGPIGEPRSAGTSTIDTMVNLPLLWWSSARGGDPNLRNVARWHARTSARLYLRPDGSTYHLLRFDPLSGALLHRGTFQGAADDSCWSRGQAWAVCGFAWAFAATGEPELLAAAERAAAYFFDRLPGDGVPPWDFSDPSPQAPRDASASAAAALGSLILGYVHPDPGGRARWRHVAEEVLGRVSWSSLNTDRATDGILLRSCYSKPHGLGVDGATAWGDFFVGLALALAVEALPLHTILGFRPSNPPS